MAEYPDDVITGSPDAAIEVRLYESRDAADTLGVFLAAITETASADYTAKQIQAWADPDGRDLDRWNTKMTSRKSFVAVVDGQIAGFSNAGHEGYVDMVFVAPTLLRRGVASELLHYGEALARGRNVGELSADVSVTARPFFEARGFEVVAEQDSVTRRVTLKNFKMRKSLN